MPPSSRTAANSGYFFRPGRRREQRCAHRVAMAQQSADYLPNWVTQGLHGQTGRTESKKDLPAEACKSLIFLLISGADARNRTGDLHITNVLLYQLSYIGDDAYSSKNYPKLPSANSLMRNFLRKRLSRSKIARKIRI